MRLRPEAEKNIREEKSPRSVGKVLIPLAAIMLALLLLFSAMFIRSYNNLQKAIEMERMDYVNEIAQQIITSKQFMEAEYAAAAQNYAAIIRLGDSSSLARIRAGLPSQDPEDMMLVSVEGDIIDLNGDSIILPARQQLMEKLAGPEEAAQLFTSVNYAGDCWLFAATLDGVVCEGTSYQAVVLSIPADDFRDSLAISLFSGRGASYIIQNDGSIEVKPEAENLAFSGYNLWTAMAQAGAKPDDLARLQRDIQEQGAGSALFEIGAEDWLISHGAIDESSSIVVAVPLTVTAAQTYSGLSGTILFAVATVLSIAALAVLLVLFFFYRDRQRGREAMAAAAKSDFFSKLSHDIRTPLNAIIGLEMMARDVSDKPQVREYLRQSSAAANYLLSIINDVLDMTRIEQSKMSLAHLPFNMNELLTDVKSIVSPMAAEKGLIFTLAVDTPFTTAYLGDQVRVKQVLMNLLSNATKFTHTGGQVELIVSREPGGEGRDNVTMRVKDTGIGMSKDYLNRIFTPFEQEQSSLTQQNTGSGLGLSIAHNLVTMMGGTIAVESKEDAGSAFTVVVPFQRSVELDVSVSRSADAALPTFPGRRALLAEDNEVNQKIALAILRRKFLVEAELAGDGQRAVAMFAASQPGHYDFILMDVKMPLMDGLEATRTIRALEREDAREIPIIALSANAFEEDVALSLAAGMNDHLAKPIDISALGQALRKIL